MTPLTESKVGLGVSTLAFLGLGVYWVLRLGFGMPYNEPFNMLCMAFSCLGLALTLDSLQRVKENNRALSPKSPANSMNRKRPQ